LHLVRRDWASAERNETPLLKMPSLPLDMIRPR
jgi:hypothetical protein